jgi:hypothetical protein
MTTTMSHVSSNYDVELFLKVVIFTIIIGQPLLSVVAAGYALT